MWVELSTFNTRREAEALFVVLRSMNIAAELQTVHSAEQEWLILVPQNQLANAQKILFEEKQQVPESSTRQKPKHAPKIYWVLGIILINFVVWLAMEMKGGSQNHAILIRFGASLAPKIKMGQWWRTVTAVFLHIGAKHLAGNTATLAILGILSLRLWSGIQLLFIYLFSGIAGNWFSFFLSPRNSVKAGASGAILGLLGSLAGARLRHLPGYASSRFKNWHVFAMLLAFYGFVVGTGPADHLAHLGGLAMGMLLSWIVPPPGHWPKPKERLLEIILGVVTGTLTLSSFVLSAFLQ
ncbi:MAG: rhomboid family intramembrane serine protease [Pseudomonadota bacterium]